jgi:hypothetical protein
VCPFPTDDPTKVVVVPPTQAHHPLLDSNTSFCRISFFNLTEFMTFENV